MQFYVRKLYYNRNEVAMRHGKKIMDKEAEWQDLKKRLAESKFRSRFRLRDAELRIIAEKGMDAVEHQCRSFILKRLAPAEPSNDGRQTPMRGHPCFIAQHATGCCCRGCLQKWHHIAAGRPLTQDQINHIIFTLMSWIREHSAGAEHVPHTPDLF